MKQIQYILFLITALAIVSCTDEYSASKSSRLVSLSVNMPGGEMTTRVGVSLVEGSKDLLVSFNADDKFSIYVRQGDVIQQVENVTFAVNGENGKQGTLAFEMPASIDMSKTYTLYGVCGASCASSYIWNNILNIDCQSNVAPLSEFQAPVWFEYTGQGKPSSIQCQYIGAFIVIHINNKSDTDNNFQISNISSNGLSFSGVFCWDENVKDFYEDDLVSIISSRDLPVAAGKSATFIYNDMPNGKVMESINVYMRIGQDITLDTKVQIPAYPKTVGKILEQGRAYHLYMTWDGKELKFVNSNHHDFTPGEAINLGLPSGTLWANCNIGAASPEDYGLYFAWGETQGYTSNTSDGRSFDWASYKWMNAGQSSGQQINKYTFADGDGSTYSCWYKDGLFVGDGLTELLPEDDAATLNWGSGWQMPSIEQFEELINSSYTTTELSTVNGVSGRKITSKSNGNSIFLPLAGFRYDKSFGSAGIYGNYWSRSLSAYFSENACILDISSDYIKTNFASRFRGYCVRPVSTDDGELDDVPGYEF